MRSLSISTLLSFGAFLVACSGENGPDGEAAATGGVAATGGAALSESGGSGGGTAAGGGGASSGGTGGATTAPVDCTPLTEAGHELCSTTATSCGVVFTDGSGCTAVCASGGLACISAFENLDATCGPDDGLPALPCDSGHQSDYCVCGADESPGSGGSSSTGGAGSGGDGSGVPTPDCNDLTGRPVLTVAKSGGQHSTITAALATLSKTNTTPTIVKIAPGTYVEKLLVDRPNVLFCGQKGQTEGTILSYGDGADTSNGNGGTLGTSGSSSVNVSANRVAFENLTIRNTRGVGSQAVALLVSGSEVEMRSCRLLGHQDTLYTKGGTQYFRDTLIEGTVDYIFGGSTAVFEDCTMHSVGGGTAITAPSTEEATPYGLVFLGGSVTAAGSVSASSVNLGRNWRPYGSTTFLRTNLGAHITGGGWVPMGENTLATARFAEFETTGPGAKPASRVPQSRQLSPAEAAELTVENVLGPWVPSFSL